MGKTWAATEAWTDTAWGALGVDTNSAAFRMGHAVGTAAGIATGVAALAKAPGLAAAAIARSGAKLSAAAGKLSRAGGGLMRAGKNGYQIGKAAGIRATGRALSSRAAKRVKSAVSAAKAKIAGVRSGYRYRPSGTPRRGPFVGNSTTGAIGTGKATNKSTAIIPHPFSGGGTHITTTSRLDFYKAKGSTSYGSPDCYEPS